MYFQERKKFKILMSFGNFMLFHMYCVCVVFNKCFFFLKKIQFLIYISKAMLSSLFGMPDSIRPDRIRADRIRPNCIRPDKNLILYSIWYVTI